MEKNTTEDLGKRIAIEGLGTLSALEEKNLSQKIKGILGDATTLNIEGFGKFEVIYTEGSDRPEVKLIS